MLDNNVEASLNGAPRTETHISNQRVSIWRTAKERSEAMRAKKKQRRSAHRATLKRSNIKG